MSAASHLSRVPARADRSERSQQLLTGLIIRKKLIKCFTCARENRVHRSATHRTRLFYRVLQLLSYIEIALVLAMQLVYIIKTVE